VIARFFWLCVGTIVYTYTGYPLLLTLVARFRPKPRPYPAHTPKLTLLIAAYNEQDVIAKKLENSLALDYPREQLQILVAADGSDDRTPQIVREYADRGVELSYSPERRGKMAAINRAMDAARGEIVVFSDANNMYTPNVLRDLAAPFADPKVGVATGAKLIASGDGALGESEGLYWKYESFIKKQETRLGCCIGVAGEVLAIRRELFTPPPESIINDDFHMTMQIVRQGYNAIYAPSAYSHERISPTAQDEITRRTRIFAGWYQSIFLSRELLTLSRPVVVWQVWSHKFLRPFVALAGAGALLANVLAVVFPPRATDHPIRRLATPVNWIMLTLQLIFYSMAWVGSRAEHTGALGKILYIPTFLVNSNLAGILGLYRFLTKRQTSLWQRVQRRGVAQPVSEAAAPAEVELAAIEL
jgi:cellulose synthase/poly-beta-1,6-N-acetylglucosamine synthase-like glycosyltransferase